MAGGAGLLGHLSEVEQFGIGMLPDRACGVGGNEADVSLRFGQRGQDIQPGLYAPFVIQQAMHLRRGPQMAGQTESTRCAPI